MKLDKLHWVFIGILLVASLVGSHYYVYMTTKKSFAAYGFKQGLIKGQQVMFEQLRVELKKQGIELKIQEEAK